MKNTTPSPLKGNGLVELIRMGNSIQLKYVKYISCKRCIQSAYHARIQRGGTGGQDSLPQENHKNIIFLAILVRIPFPWKITKLPSQHSLSGYHWPVSETPFQWRFAGGPMMAHLKWYLDPLSSSTTKKRTLSKLDPL